MNVGLFVPCYIDQFYPSVGIATLQLLEKTGMSVVYPTEQTCCGQPMANSGFARLGAACNSRFISNFSSVDYIVCPSGSCTLYIKEHLRDNEQTAAAENIQGKIFELTEFLTDVIGIQSLPGRFPYKVGLHQSCHGLRGLKLSQMSELVAPPFSKPEELLKMVEGLELVSLDMPDECCGFGGTFCIGEEAVSVKMGKDRVSDHLLNGAEYITSSDMSCLMQLEGILKRQRSNIKVKHIAEILNGN